MPWTPNRIVGNGENAAKLEFFGNIIHKRLAIALRNPAPDAVQPDTIKGREIFGMDKVLKAVTKERLSILLSLSLVMANTDPQASPPMLQYPEKFHIYPA